MLLPIKWLKEYLDIDNDVMDICNKVTLTGSHVESIEKLGKNISGIVVGKILEIYRHENSKKLWITKVDIGNEIVQIVTGAQNLKQYDLVPVATVGSTLADGTNIGEAKLAGEISQGMFCSYAELGYSDSVIPKDYKDGVLRLFCECELGEDIRNVLDLNDTIVEFEITPNRPDCLSIIGISREIAASFDKYIKLPGIYNGTYINSSKLKSSIKTNLCSRYAFSVVKNINIAESNRKIQNYLINTGVRPINNIVDATNFVMLETGQPLHAFDFDKIEGNINVRTATEGEKVVTLDDVERTLTEKDILICDDVKPIAIAGVMGLKNSQIDENTKNIIIESAHFDKSTIKNTSKKLGLKTDASIKYEKGLSSAYCVENLKRVLKLIENENIEVSEINDNINSSINEVEINITVDRLNKLLGIQLNKEETIKYLNLLEISTIEKNDNIICKIPNFRLDLSIEEDLIEEVGRLYGFFNIKPNCILGSNTVGRKSKKRNFEDFVKQCMLNLSTFEITTYSFIGPNIINKSMMDMENIIKIINPLGEEFSIMRKSLIPNMIEVISKNLNYKNKDLLVYELGNTFVRDNDNNLENKKLVIGCYGKYEFYYLKDLVSKLLEMLNIYNYDFKKKTDILYLHPGISAEIYIESSKIGEIGQVSYEVCKNFSVKNNIYVCELDLEVIFKHFNKEIIYKPLSKFPSVKRDLAILVKSDIDSGDIESIIKENAGELLQNVSLFDIYIGDQVEDGYKSMAYTLNFQSEDKTLTDDDINPRISDILKNLESKLGATLRS